MKNEVKFKGVPTKGIWAVGPCKNEDIAKQVLLIGHNAGFKWASGDSFLNLTFWSLFKSATCYYLIEGEYGRNQFYKKHGFKIIPAADFIAANQHLLNPEKPEQPKERFGVGRGKFLVEVTGPNTCLVSIRKRNGEVEWQEYLPIEFATEFAKVETLEKKADSLRKGRDRWEKKTLELRNEVEALTETLSKLNKVHDELNEDHTHQLNRVIELEEKAESLDVLLNASKEAQETLRIENSSLSHGSKYLKERNEEITRQLQTSERNRKNTEEEKNDLEVKYESLLETVKSERNNSKIYFWGSIVIILLMLAKILWV